MEKKPKVLVIVGPTASGKTSLAIDLAKKFDGEVISSDSRQVYKDLDIGTEKATEEEMAGVTHHLLDVVEPQTVYTATDFKRDAEAAITDITQRHKLPIVAGGTFFYVDVLLGRISTAEVPPNLELREKLSKFSTTDLFDKLTALDPNFAERIDKDNPRRLIRAIEVATALGAVPTPSPTDCPYDVLMIGIKTDGEELRARLRVRAQTALNRGLIEETKKLLNSGVSCERLSEIGHEYRIVMEYLNGDLNEDQFLQKLEDKNWQYAKRQLTWLKRDSSIHWFWPTDREVIYTEVDSFLHNENG